MAITTDDFSKIWASTSPLTPYKFSESNYKEGWNFIGGTPPSRQMWDFLQKNNDEKMQYLANNYLPLSGGTMTGDILFSTNNESTVKKTVDNSAIRILGGSAWDCGGSIFVYGKSNSGQNPGGFELNAHDGTNVKGLLGKPDGTLTWGNQPLLPVGIVQAFAGTTIPNGWLLCDGSAVSRTTYANLYACIGTTYGAGNGSTTFNLPNLIDKFVQGNATSGTVKAAGLPNITGSFGNIGTKANSHFGLPTTDSSAAGAFSIASESVSTNDFTTNGLYTGSRSILFNASSSNPIYGNSTTVQPPALTMKYIIKY